jgi:hypothetical protein
MSSMYSNSDIYRLLDEADRLDGYVSACRASPINSAARLLCQYHPWNDQSLAEGIMSDEEAKIIIMAPSAEGGMPHTRAPNIICIPAYFPESKLHETLKHELVHISQRQNPEVWRKRGLAEGWTPILEADLPSEWVQRCRLNPDTYDARFWAWEGRHVPLPLFVREDKPELRDIQVRWWDMKEGRLNSQAPTTFVRKYGNVAASSAEHPYELWAYSHTK